MALTPSKSYPGSVMSYPELLEDMGYFDLLKKSKTKLIGYTNTINEIKDLIRTRENFIAKGPSGVGKTTVISKIAEQCFSSDSPRRYFYISASWLSNRTFSKPSVHPEKQLSKLFLDAIANSPSLIFIDELDRICDGKGEGVKERMFLAMKDQFALLRRTASEVLVVAATNKPELIDPELMKHFDEEVHFSLPSCDDRLAYIKKLFPKFLSDEHKDLADRTKFYLYKDLTRLFKLARRKNPVNLSYECVKSVITVYKPETIQKYTTPYQEQRWSDIGGIADVKERLRESVIDPLQYPEKYQKADVNMDRGALLYGPPGCSKTMLAHALATESNFNFIAIKGPELLSKYVGDTEAAIRRLYQNAREIAPCIIFFDEIDGFAADRSSSRDSSVGTRLVTQLLTEFNGPPDNVFTLAATNRPHHVDQALLRPGRLDTALYIPLPELEDRKEIFKVHMRKRSFKFDQPLDDVIEQFAKRTHGYSGADIMQVVKTAAKNYIRDKTAGDHIEMKHFEKAFGGLRVKSKDIASYKEFYEMTKPDTESYQSQDERRLHINFNESLSLD